MTSQPNRHSIRLASNPYQRRTGLVPMVIGISLGWVFVGLWFWVSILALFHSWIWAALVAGSTVVFAFFLGALTFGLIRDANRDYQLEVNETEVVLVVVDRLKHKQSTQMVLLDDIQYAEYYPYSDSASVILHAAYFEMEVPLWPLGGHAQDVIDFLAGRGVSIMNVQFDDKVPV